MSRFWNDLDVVQAHKCEPVWVASSALVLRPVEASVTPGCQSKVQTQIPAQTCWVITCLLHKSQPSGWLRSGLESEVTENGASHLPGNLSLEWEIRKTRSVLCPWHLSEPQFLHLYCRWRLWRELMPNSCIRLWILWGRVDVFKKFPLAQCLALSKSVVLAHRMIDSSKQKRLCGLYRTGNAVNGWGRYGEVDRHF